MKRLNLYCFIGGLLLVLMGTVSISHFVETPNFGIANTSSKIGQYAGMAFIPLFGLLMLVESIRRFKLEN
ncbi:MAG: hypothetical protein QM610_10690 [Chitinophagaceae bacterium]